MSSGAHHYAEAERLLEAAKKDARDATVDGGEMAGAIQSRVLIAMQAARVHAELAAVAAHAEGEGLTIADDWRKVLA